MRQLTARGADGYDSAVAAAPVWSVSLGTPGTIAGAGDTATFTASATTGGAGSVVATVGGVTAIAPVVVRGRDAAENENRGGEGR